MIDQVRADAGKICNNLDPMCANVIAGPDTRQHQKLRRSKCPGTEQHFTRCGNCLSLAVSLDFHARRTMARYLDPSCHGACENGEILSYARGSQICFGRVSPSTVREDRLDRKSTR